MMQPSKLQSSVWIRVVDDDEDVRQSLSMMLRCRGWQVKTFPGAQEFLAQDDLTTPGCLILDVQMPETDGLELQATLNKRGTTLPIIFLTAHGDIAMAVSAMQKGAAHFLQKTSTAEEIANAVALFSERSFRASESRQSLETEEIRERYIKLTKRERQIVSMTHSMTSRLIAEELGISERTVENHRISACKKMGTMNTSEILKQLETLRERGLSIGS